MSTNLKDVEVAILRIGDRIRNRIDTPRPTRWNERGRTSPVRHYYDRVARPIYGAFWNGRLLGLGKTIWHSPGGVTTEFHAYVRRLLEILIDEQVILRETNGEPFTAEEMALINRYTRDLAKKITTNLKRSGNLEIRRLETI